jgi:hypothetical protein
VDEVTMAVSTTGVHFNSQLHERIVKLKEQIGAMHLYKPNAIGFQVMIALLADWWAESTPDKQWVKERLEQYPKWGRPRKSCEVDLEPRVALRSHTTKGHDLFNHMRPGRPRRYVFCKRCTLQWDTELYPERPQQPCPVSAPWSQEHPKTWTKSELRALKFDESEIQWAAE